jgi:hypothetical protein
MAKRGPTAATLDKEARRASLQAKADKLMQQQLRPNDLTVAYVKLRDKRRELAAQDDDLGMQLAALERVLMYRMKELGQDTFTAAGHTVYQSTLTNAKVDNRAAFIEWMLEQDLTDEMDVRPTVDTVKRWQEEHTPVLTAAQLRAGKLPLVPPVPGVTLSTYIALRVRKAG